MSLLYLVKENDEFISFCDCDQGPVGGPGQMDCPWCGCGWLFTCTQCRKAFSFAKAIETDRTWEELARDDLYGFAKEEPPAADIANWVDMMQQMTEHIQLGQSYVYLDGFFIPADETDFEVRGWHAKHQFTKVPQVLALEDETIVEQVLGNPDYWTENEITDREE